MECHQNRRRRDLWERPGEVLWRLPLLRWRAGRSPPGERSVEVACSEGSRRLDGPLLQCCTGIPKSSLEIRFGHGPRHRGILESGAGLAQNIRGEAASSSTSPRFPSVSSLRLTIANLRWPSARRCSAQTLHAPRSSIPTKGTLGMAGWSTTTVGNARSVTNCTVPLLPGIE